MRASISIFPKKIKYTDERTQPETPSEVFEAVQRVIINKNCELVRSNQGLYVVSYSETGPSKTLAGWENWLPVYVAKIEQWSSGGIQKSEMEEFLKENKLAFI